MSYPDDFVPALASDFLRHNVDGEAVVWSPWRSVPTALDAVETVMLEVVDGEATVAELSRDVHEEVGIPLETAEAQVRRTIATFDRAGLLTSSSRGQAAVEAIANRRMFVNPVSY